MFTSISCQPELKVVEAMTVIVYLRVKPTGHDTSIFDIYIGG